MSLALSVTAVLLQPWLRLPITTPGKRDFPVRQPAPTPAPGSTKTVDSTSSSPPHQKSHT